MRKVFPNKGQIDVIAILMILGESTLWKAIWSRFRSRRAHWSRWIFAISPGWAPLASTLFALLGSSDVSPNLIFSRPPESVHEPTLLMTNLSSGASHSASNTVLQNVWQVWKHSARLTSPTSVQSEGINITKEVGVVDVNLDALLLENPATLWLQATSLAIQFTTALLVGLLKWNFETTVTLITGFTGQTLLLIAVTPSEAVWNRSIRGHRCMLMMLHRALDSTEVLIVRSTTLNGDFHSKLVQSLPSIFLWKSSLRAEDSSLLSAVGILLAAEFPSASAAAKTLFPTNQRFETTLKELKSMLNDILCSSCKKVTRVPQQAYRDYHCSRQGQGVGTVPDQARPCRVLLADKVQEQMNKQYKDALATVACFLSSAQTYVDMPAIETAHFKEDPFYTWILSN